MDAVEFLKQYSRMVAFGVQPFKVPSNLPYEEIVSRVEQWAKEHPVKTRQSEFLKMFPEAEIFEDRYLNICPALISEEYRDNDYNCCKVELDCGKCKRDFWLKEIE